MKRKRLLAVLCTLTLVVSLAGCGKKDETPEDGIKEQSATFDYTIEINGAAHDFPMTYEKFTSLGWEVDDEEEIKMRDMYPGVDALGIEQKYYYRNGGIEAAKVTFYNPTDETAKVKDCLVVGISVQPIEEFGVTVPVGCVVLSQGITLGKSTYDEVLAAYGKSLLDSGPGGHAVYGEEGTYQKLYLYFSEDGIVEGVGFIKDH